MEPFSHVLNLKPDLDASFLSQPYSHFPLSQHLTQTFFCQPAEQVAPEPNGCLLMKRPEGGMLLYDDLQMLLEANTYNASR